MDNIQLLAVYLHDKFCSSNHCDACGWYHEVDKETHDWAGWTHKHYLEKANQLLIFLEGLK